MFRKKMFWALVFCILLNLSCISYAENSTLNCKYPDYAYEFTGRDKCEGFNRKLFIVNLKLNKCVLRPLNIVWASIMPKYGIERLQNAYNNINYPMRFLSCVLQKDFKASKQETARFFINTTVGAAGLYDPAKNRFKLEPRTEDMGQVLAHYKVKSGPYLVLPVVRGSVRDLVGQLLNYPLRPLSYIPIAGGIANAVFNINNTTNVQPIIKKIDESYADPYEIARQIDGITAYIKNENLDRAEVLKEKTALQDIVKINNPSNIALNNSGLKCDIKLCNYNPQSALIDSMRTSMFVNPDDSKSKWSTLSVWNRNFEKRIKNSSINLYPKRQDYSFRYILQKSKTSPLALIYPSIGEGIHSDHSNVLAKILYDKGYSVIIQGSAFHWEFVKSMPDGYHPGLVPQDAGSLRLVSSKIIADVERKKSVKFTDRIIVGTSYGAMTGLFVVAQDDKNVLNISKCIAISPPINLNYALNKMDSYCSDWKKDSSDIKMRAAVLAEKTVNYYKDIPNKKTDAEFTTFPFTEEEAKLVVGFVIKQKFSDTVFTAEKCSRGKKTDIYNKINQMSFYDYSQKHLFANSGKSENEFEQAESLSSIEPFLKNRKKYKIYHAADDYFVNSEQLVTLKKTTGNKSVLFNNGSHLGFLYRKEFLDDFKREIDLKTNDYADEIQPINDYDKDSQGHAL